MSRPGMVAGVTRSSMRHARRIPLPLMVVVAVLLGIGGGVAYAYFTASGAGQGATATEGMQTVSVVTAGTPTAPLLPGGPAGDLTFEVSNPNDYLVLLVGVELDDDGTVTFDDAHSNCSTTTLDPIVTVDVPAVNFPVPLPANATVPVILPAAVSMDVAATNSCQGATITVPISMTVQTP